MTSTLRVPQNLRLAQMRYWAWLTGMPSSGARTEFLRLLTQKIENSPPILQSQKIISVDMGIRNLAFCAIETPHADSQDRRIKVTDWKRMDLLKSEFPSDSDAKEIAASEGDKRVRQKSTESSLDVAIKALVNVPPAFAKVALDLSRDFLSYSPDVILIERQRYRTLGAKAVNEWTVRVNQLEAMLWACLETLRSTKQHSATFPETRSIDPARVAAFAPRMDLLPIELLRTGLPVSRKHSDKASLPRTKIDKKLKVDIARSWVRGEKGNVQLEFSDDAAKIAEAFKVNGRSQKEIQRIAGGKIDDLADCLLQAVAWAKWQENQNLLRKMWTETEG